MYVICILYVYGYGYLFVCLCYIYIAVRTGQIKLNTYSKCVKLFYPDKVISIKYNAFKVVYSLLSYLFCFRNKRITFTLSVFHINQYQSKYFLSKDHVWLLKQKIIVAFVICGWFYVRYLKNIWLQTKYFR